MDDETQRDDDPEPSPDPLAPDFDRIVLRLVPRSPVGNGYVGWRKNGRGEDLALPGDPSKGLTRRAPTNLFPIVSKAHTASRHFF